MTSRCQRPCGDLVKGSRNIVDTVTCVVLMNDERSHQLTMIAAQIGRSSCKLAAPPSPGAASGGDAPGMTVETPIRFRVGVSMLWRVFSAAT
ncbi:hypothetical protein KEM60_01295 [Austwickia sp. TVS 96-490-7B]|nr:hypothetical protein [Austwickia sp. TVS 96-490-7B]